MASLSSVLGLVGWAIVPDLATRQALTFVHRALSSRIPGFIPPVQGTPAYRKHYAYTFAVVVLGYLLYNMVQSARALPPNFYEILGVSPNVDENGLKLAFRQFAKKNHPDRPGVGEQGAQLFMMVREVFEALKNPVVRFAYDRFGSSVLSWKTCSTPRDYLYQGLLQSSGYHIVSGAALLFWSTIGKPSSISFWRYLLFVFFFAAELALILAPTTVSSTIPTILTTFFPNRVTFQHILFLHQLFLFFSVALSRVAPLFSGAEDDPRVEKAVLERIHILAGAADREASIILHSDLHSISPSTVKSPATNGRATLPLMTPLPQPTYQNLMQSLSSKMENLIIEHNLKKDSGPLRSAWELAIRRGRSLLLSPSGTNNQGNSASTTIDQGQQSLLGKNFWEAGMNEVEVEVPVTTTGTSDSTIIDGSAYFVVDDSSLRKGTSTSTSSHERIPSPRPPSQTSSPSKKESRELLVD